MKERARNMLSRAISVLVSRIVGFGSAFFAECSSDPPGCAEAEVALCALLSLAQTNGCDALEKLLTARQNYPFGSRGGRSEFEVEVEVRLEDEERRRAAVRRNEKGRCLVAKQRATRGDVIVCAYSVCVLYCVAWCLR